MVNAQDDAHASASPSSHAVPLHPVFAFIVAFILTTFIFQALPGKTLVLSFMQGLLLSALMLVIVKLSDRKALAKPKSAGVLGRWIIYVLLVAALSGVVTFYLVRVGLRGFELNELALRLCVVCAVCLVTGIFEEALFRVLAINAFVIAFDSKRTRLIDSSPLQTNAVFKAALLSAILFAFLHISIAGLTSGHAMVQLQTIIKFFQTALFGLIMAAFYIRTKSLWLIALMHTVFDILYLGPVMMAHGIPSALVTNEPVNLILLAVTTALLLAPAISAVQYIKDTPTEALAAGETSAYE
ncbi:CPBP family intramembrane glutamic endopeptidase [Eggerthellaceae bacterium 3-80]|nr:CPBP family intramembrane metalloprotease [bacterium D16-34]